MYEHLCKVRGGRASNFTTKPNVVVTVHEGHKLTPGTPFWVSKGSLGYPYSKNSVV